MKLFQTASGAAESSWTDDLPGERARLVRLCARLTGNSDAAEDLAQETLFEAWRQAPRLRDVTVWRSFVFGIARNVCLRWQRSHGREMSRRIRSAAGDDKYSDFPYAASETESAPDPFDMEGALETRERALLIDRALHVLPTETRQLLVERYVDDLPQAEIAARHGVTENAVGVRIHRAKAVLRRAVAAHPVLSAEAAAYGLLSAAELHNAALWHESRIWCPRCGKRHLEVRFDRAPDGILRDGNDTTETPLFGVRCPDCEGGLGFEFTTAHPALDTRQVLGGVTGYKPALNRLHGWWANYYNRAINGQTVSCPLCSRPTQITHTPPADLPPEIQRMPWLFLPCSHCGKTCYTSPSGIAFHQPEVQLFWRQHPRFALLGEREIVLEGREAVAVTLQSQISRATLEVFLDRATLKILDTRETAA